MLRAISEIAVVIKMMSVSEKPSCAARLRPTCRAEMMSASERTITRWSSAISITGHPLLEQLEGLVEVKRGGGRRQPQAELGHGEGDAGRDAYHHRRGAAQLEHLGQAVEHPGSVRIHHV